MAKISKSLIFSILGTGYAAANSDRKASRSKMKTLSEDRVFDAVRAETYDSDSTCKGRKDLADFGDVQCCPFKESFFGCTGCHPGLSADCHRQPVFAADYFYDDYGDYWLENLPSRDCFCDINCKDRGDCCDDIEDTCSHWFSPRVSKTIKFDRGDVKYFHAGVGKTFEEATALCKKHGARIIQPESPADMEALSDELGWTGKADRVSLWLPWANMENGKIMPSKDDEYTNGSWVNFLEGTALPDALMGYVKGKKKTIDGMGTGCTMMQNDRRKNLLLLDAVCTSTNRVLCEETEAAGATAKPEPTAAPTAEPTVEPTVEPTIEPTMAGTTTGTTTTSAPAPTPDADDVWDLDILMANVFGAFGGDKDDYLNSLMCSGDNAGANDEIEIYFDGICPPKTVKVQQGIEKQIKNFDKKIAKEAKKLMDFSHKFCDIQFAFTAEHVPYHKVDFSTAKTMANGMEIVQATWMNSVESQLKAKGGKCTNFVTKTQTSVKKLVKWNQDLVKKVKLNGNNLEKKQIVTLGKEVAKAKRDAAKAAKGK